MERTLDYQHTEQLKKIKENKIKYAKLLKKKKNLENKINKLSIGTQSEKNMNTIIELDTTFKINSFNQTSRKVAKFKHELKETDKALKELLEHIEEETYYLKSNMILFSYYDHTDHPQETTISQVKTNKKYQKIYGKNEIANKNLFILDYFDKDSDKLDNQEHSVDYTTALKENVDELDTSSVLKIQADIDLDKYEYNLDQSMEYENIFIQKDKKKILDDYLEKTQDDFFLIHKAVNQMCVECGSERKVYASDGLILCQTCGQMEFTLVESDKPHYKENQTSVSYFAYKRVNHFNEWISQFQAKQNAEVPKEVIDTVQNEINKERLNPNKKITNKKMREWLKRNGYSKYYENIPQIMSIIKCETPPVITKEAEEKLHMMFKMIQEPFMKVCPPERKNFLSYSYVLHKFVELLELDELKQYFPLLKNRDNLDKQDKIWKGICEILGWQFISSF